MRNRTHLNLQVRSLASNQGDRGYINVLDAQQKNTMSLQKSHLALNHLVESRQLIPRSQPASLHGDKMPRGSSAQHTQSQSDRNQINQMDLSKLNPKSTSNQLSEYKNSIFNQGRSGGGGGPSDISFQLQKFEALDPTSNLLVQSISSSKFGPRSEEPYFQGKRKSNRKKPTIQLIRKYLDVGRDSYKEDQDESSGQVYEDTLKLQQGPQPLNDSNVAEDALRKLDQLKLHLKSVQTQKRLQNVQNHQYFLKESTPYVNKSYRASSIRTMMTGGGGLRSRNVQSLKSLTSKNNSLRQLPPSILSDK